MLGSAAFTIIAAFALLVPSTTASPFDLDLTPRDLNSIINNVAPKLPGGTGQIQCYSLPYGAIGFASHILTYWTLFWILRAKRPFMPWKDLSWKKGDVILALAMLALTIAVSVWTIVRCRDAWQFLVIAVWKLTMSVSLGCVLIHKSLQLAGGANAAGKGSATAFHPGGYHSGYHVVGSEAGSVGTNGARTPSSWGPGAWLLLYGCGVVVGMAGLVSLVHHNWHNHEVQLITAVFAAAVFGSAAVIALLICFGNGGVFASGLVGIGIAASLIAVLSAFYSDWILAAVMGKLTGYPSSDVAPLYWIYFLAKRLPLLSL